jgi:outer membrane protein assembly factor BamB
MMKSVFGKASVRTAIPVWIFMGGGLCLIAVLCLIDSHSFLAHASAEQPLGKEQALADAGWPHLRGPHYDGVSGETDLADSWPADGPPTLWNREIGAGYAGLIVVGNRSYTLAQSLTTQKLLALDADTGRTIWEHGYEWPYEPGGMYPGPRATPTFSRGRIYFASPDGLVECVRAEDGQPVWSVNVMKKFGGRGTDFGYSCSPLVEEGKVILPVGGPTASMVALDADSGATVWTSGDAPASYCSAMPITFRGRRLVVAFMQNEFDGFDLSTGRLLWHEPYSRGYDEHANSPLYDEPYLRTMQPFRAGSDLHKIEEVPRKRTVPIVAPANIELSPLTAASERSGYRLKLVRHDEKMSNDVASSVLVGGYIYGFDLRDIQTARHRPSRGEFRCMNFKTGDILWSSDRPGQSTIVVADGKLLLFNDRGEVILIRANPRRYEELGRTEVFRGEICWTAPALDHGRLYLRSPTRAACLYLGKPERMSGPQRELAVPTASIPKAHRLQFGWLIGAERECPFELPAAQELLQWYVWSLAASPRQVQQNLRQFHNDAEAVEEALNNLKKLGFGHWEVHSPKTGRPRREFVLNSAPTLRKSVIAIPNRATRRQTIGNYHCQLPCPPAVSVGVGRRSRHNPDHAEDQEAPAGTEGWSGASEQGKANHGRRV